jgi:hypothetical protein
MASVFCNGPVMVSTGQRVQNRDNTVDDDRKSHIKLNANDAYIEDLHLAA